MAKDKRVGRSFKIYVPGKRTSKAIRVRIRIADVWIYADQLTDYLLGVVKGDGSV